MKKIEIFVKNLILNLLLFLKPVNRDKKNGKDRVSKILLIRLNRIGDALVTTPLLEELKKISDAELFMLADKKNFFVYNNNPCLKKVIIFQKGFKGIREVLSFIKDEKIDTVIDLHDDVSTTVSYLVALAKAPNKYALEKENRKIYTKTIPKPDPERYHVVERLVQIAKLFGIEPEIRSANIHFYPSDKALNFSRKYLKEKFNGENFLVGINISAGSKSRFWGIERYKKLIKLLDSFNCDKLLLSAPADKALAEIICGNGTDIFISSNYEEFGAVISELNMLITPDTAAVHIASAYKVPVFGLYVQYNTNDMIWSPYKSDFEYVLTKEPTLKQMNFEKVANELKPFLKKYIR